MCSTLTISTELNMYKNITFAVYIIFAHIIPGVKKRFIENVCNGNGDIFTIFYINNNLRINISF